MRTIVFVLMLMFTLTACAGKGDMTPEEAARIEAAETEGAAASDAAQDEAAADTGEGAAASPEATLDDDFSLDPIGEVKMMDGSTFPISKMERIGKYYIYISGKLNGRSSTVISLTRMNDLRKWLGFTFTDPKTFSIVTQAEKQLSFADSRVYIGSGSHDSYTFWTVNPNNFQEEKITVKKKDVHMIVFKPVDDN